LNPTGRKMGGDKGSREKNCESPNQVEKIVRVKKSL